jgi:hypothetical protein
MFPGMTTTTPAAARPTPPSSFGGSARVDVSGLEVPGMDALPRVGAEVELGVLAGFLSGLDLGSLPSDFDVLDVVAAWDRVVSSASAAQVVAVGELAARPEVYGPDDDPSVVARRAERAPVGTTTRSWLAEELAARLGESVWTGGRLGQSGVQLPHRFPLTLAGHRAGRVSAAKVRHLVAACAHLDDDQARQVDARVAHRAADLTPTRLRQAVKRAVLRVDPATATERRQRAERDRCVRIAPTDGGMAELWALLPAFDATKLGNALDDHARAARAAGDERTLDQLRADALTAGISAEVEVQVVIPASVLLGAGDDPAAVTGHGPVDAELARILAADATWRRLVTDPDDHTLLSVGGTTYRPGAVLTRHLRARDQNCRFPTCDRPASGCDLDHTVAFPGGPTTPDNLGALCRRHHRLKHDPAAEGAAAPRLRQAEPGTFTWTLPTGHTYRQPPPALLEPDDPLVIQAPDDVPFPWTGSLVEYGLGRYLSGYVDGLARAA